jgi:hypothetical protein
VRLGDLERRDDEGVPLAAISNTGLRLFKVRVVLFPLQGTLFLTDHAAANLNRSKLRNLVGKID